MREHAGFAVDVGDLALDRGGCAVTRVESEGAEFLGERRDVDDRRADGAGAHGSTAFLPVAGSTSSSFLSDME